MKYIYVTILLACVFVLNINAQNAGIRFEKHADWGQIVKKAIDENKLIFVDCYTSWCGPCKKLAQTVFIDEEVGNYFNKHFVNVKYDMEKDSAGIQLNKKHRITAYPTLLFIDPETEDVIHKVFGFLEKEQLLDVGEQAMNPKENLKKLEFRFVQGDRNQEFLKNYATALKLAGEKNKQNEILRIYLNHLPIKDFAKKENWVLLNKLGLHSFSKVVKNMVDSLDYAYQIVGKEELNQYLFSVLYYTVYENATWELKKEEKFDETRNAELICCLEKLDNRYVPGMLAMLSTAKYVRVRDFDGMLNEMRKNLQANVFVERQGVEYYVMFMKQLALCDDVAILQKGIDWLQEKLDSTKDLNLKNSYVRCQNNLLEQQERKKALD